MDFKRKKKIKYYNCDKIEYFKLKYKIKSKN